MAVTQAGFAGDAPVLCWTFDGARDSGAEDQASERRDSLQGAIEVARGVRGSGLKFDGFTSRLVRAAEDLPAFGPALTVEAWIAPQEYSWAWTGIVDHDQDARAGFLIDLNHTGHVGFYASVDGQWLGCDSQEPVALLRWAHVAGTFDPASGFTIYVNGQRAGSREANGNLKPAEGLDLLIGRSHRKQFPALTERAPSKKFLSNMEWQQTELLNQPGTRPQDNVELEAMTIVNMDWELPISSHTISEGIGKEERDND